MIFDSRRFCLDLGDRFEACCVGGTRNTEQTRREPTHRYVPIDTLEECSASGQSSPQIGYLSQDNLRILKKQRKESMRAPLSIDDRGK